MKLPLILAAMTASGSAYAGTVTIDRNDGALSTADVSALTSEAARWPFALHVIAGDYGNRSALANAAHECVTAPDVVCVGVDPGHHVTESRFGTGTNVHPNDYNLIAASGNSAFKSGNWRGGIESIADRARESATGPTVIVQPAASPISETAWFFWSIIGAAAVGGLFFAWRVRKRQQENEADMVALREERIDAEARGAEERQWYNDFRSEKRPRVAAPVAQPTTVVVNQTSSSGGTDMLLGYELGRATAPVEVMRESNRGYLSILGGGSDSSSSDYSSSSSDSGGGGSDFGGGFDSGGGGFDGGGGGSDF